MEANLSKISSSCLFRFVAYRCVQTTIILLLGGTIYFGNGRNKTIAAISMVPHVFVIFLLGLFEFVLVLFRRELVSIGNWAIQKELRSNGKCTLTSALTSEFLKIAQGNFGRVDWLGLFAFTSVFTYSILMGIFLPSLMIAFGVDPLSILVSTWTSTFGNSWIFKIAYGFFLVFIMQVTLSPARTFVILGIGMARSAIVIPNMMLRMNLCPHQLQIYTELSVALSVLYIPLKYTMGGGVIGEFFVMIAMTTLSLRGWKYLPFNLHLIVVLLTVAILGSTIILFNSCCGIYNKTSKVLQKNQRQLVRVDVVGRQRVQRVLKSLRPIAFPVSDVGIMDNEIQRNYVNRLVVEESNLLILINKLSHKRK